MGFTAKSGLEHSLQKTRVYLFEHEKYVFLHEQLNIVSSTWKQDLFRSGLSMFECAPIYTHYGPKLWGKGENGSCKWHIERVREESLIRIFALPPCNFFQALEDKSLRTNLPHGWYDEVSAGGLPCCLVSRCFSSTPCLRATRLTKRLSPLGNQGIVAM